ncbi:MAG TPA: hypothetical protein VL086_08690 [Candidatus Nitrosotalea sp.]|jgi:hypothetical protein|nr:hypothetical protein [Candidatus Nitrosotalea sp.]
MGPRSNGSGPTRSIGGASANVVAAGICARNGSPVTALYVLALFHFAR